MPGALSMDLIDWSNHYLDDTERQQSYEALGVSMFAIFGAKNDKVSSQVRNLQSLSNSAVRFSDVELFIKNQMGRDNDMAKQWGRLDPHPLDQLRQIGDDTNPNGPNCKVPQNLRVEMAAHSVPVRLHIVRGWIRAVVGGYMFAKATQDLG